MKDSVLRDKSIAFAIHLIKICQKIQSSKKEYILTKQIVRSGTSIGANLHEGGFAFSKADFIYKLNLALKEAVETQYWLILLKETNYVSDTEADTLFSECGELKAMLITSLNTARKNSQVS